MPRRFLLIAALLTVGLSAYRPSLAQDAAPPRGAGKGEEVAESNGSRPPDTILTLVEASGSIGAMIILLSIAGVALILEHAMTIRRTVLIPKGLPEELHSLITQDDFTKAEQLCKLRPSYLSYVVLSGLQEVRMGYRAVEKSMEDASQEQAARLFRKVEYLALIANIAPMLGLLGTVYGILLAFKKIAETQGAAVASDMAGGVYLALVTTVEGLLVGIPALGAYAIFRARVEQLASEVGLVSEQVFNNYKRSRALRKLSRQNAPSPD
ncbi:MotA/TolQ/ExbB proton channel family protein [bacterium]|nr:MotA/TolQ/ExbB proton channel family protein [bacterium]